MPAFCASDCCDAAEPPHADSRSTKTPTKIIEPARRVCRRVITFVVASPSRIFCSSKKIWTTNALLRKLSNAIGLRDIGGRQSVDESKLVRGNLIPGPDARRCGHRPMSQGAVCVGRLVAQDRDEPAGQRIDVTTRDEVAAPLAVDTVGGEVVADDLSTCTERLRHRDAPALLPARAYKCGRPL